MRTPKEIVDEIRQVQQRLAQLKSELSQAQFRGLVLSHKGTTHSYLEAADDVKETK